MSQTPKSHRLLEGVKLRLTVRQFISRTVLVTLILSAVYLVLLLVGRLTGYFPEWFTPASVLIVPVVAALIAALLPNRPSESDAAHAVDEYGQTEDLFLTLLTLNQSTSEYKPLVLNSAEKVAPKINAEQVAPFHWENSWAWSTGALVALMLGAFFVPTLDPFGKVAEARQEEEQKKLLEATGDQTKKRKELLAQKKLDEENSEEVEKAVDSLKVGFQKMDKGDRKANLKRLNKHQKEIGEMFRKINSGELKSLFDKFDSEQKFGSLENQELFRQWQKQMQAGDAEEMKKEVGDLAEALKELAKTDDPVKKTNLEREIQKKLDELQDFSENKIGSKALTSALKRAQQQLEASEGKPLSKEAMESIKESLEVAQMEMELVAQSARDLKELEDALEAIAAAKQANAEGNLDGEMFDSELTMEDFAELYAQLTGQSGMGEGEGEGEGEGDGEGDGDGLGGQGFGEGGEAPEDDSVETGFVNETSKSAIQKGKILLSMKTKGLSEAGEVEDEEYKRIVGEIQQSLDDVIDQEQIPPGYVDGIKKYFDTLDKDGAGN